MRGPPLQQHCVSENSFCVSPEFKVFGPWDLLRGKDVFKSSSELRSDVSKSDLTHWGPNCATFSRAREIPIHNVRNPPRPLRSTGCPRGIPDELAVMSKKQRRRLDDDTKMADMAAELSFEQAEAGKGFTLEHPAGSIAWSLDSWVKLSSRPDVELYTYSTCMYEGSKRRKMQGLLTNVSEIGEQLNKVCSGGRFCDRTGEPHLKWRPLTSGNKVVQFQTGDEREYPVGFCNAYARGLRKRPAIKSFLEVFSGPNAPLSEAVAEATGTRVPGERRDTKGKGVKSELQHLAQLISNPVKTRISDTVETSFNRVNAVESGRQPGYGKRVQLIHDGLNDQFRHVELAKTLDHPFNSLGGLKEAHGSVVEGLSDTGGVDIRKRLAVLERWKGLAASSEVAKSQASDDMSACRGANKLGRKPRTAFMKVVGSMYGIEDKAVPDLCLTGMPIVGRALESPFFFPYEVPSTISVRELLGSVLKLRPKLMGRVERMAAQEPKEQNEAIWEKTLKEVKEGSMDGPFPLEQMEEQHGHYFNVVPSFGLRQGNDESGKPKFRRIDDHSACLNNSAGTRSQRIEMASVDYLVVMLKSLSAVSTEPLVVGTEDMRAAYRQVPVPDSQLALTVTAVFNPVEGRANLFNLYGQPFGAAHAVPNFYRLAEWASRVLTKAFSLLLDHFFDDFFLVARTSEAEVCSFCLREAFCLLGLTLDDKKSQPPSSVSQVLGVVINTETLRAQRTLLVEPKQTRRENLVAIIDKVLLDGYLAPSLAASVLGKFGFLCSTLYGKVGRCCTGAVRGRQYSTSSDCSLTPALRVSLVLMKLFSTMAPPREFSLNKAAPPAILYTDASDVPERTQGRSVVGAVLFTSSPEKVYYTSWVVPEHIVSRWELRSTYIGQLELLAGPLALYTWSPQLTKSQIIHFVDNESAAAGLVRGYSSKSDSSALIGEYWLTAAKHSLEIYIDRVESKSNISDGPSRLVFDDMAPIGATWSPPVTSSIGTQFPEFTSLFSGTVR